MGTELVSIIMLTYKCECFIGKSIKSVQAQTYQNWELIIVDDCSTDVTFAVVEPFVKQDGRIKYKRNDRIVL